MNFFKDANEVIQSDTPEMIVGKGAMKFIGWFDTSNGWVTYSVSVEIKPGRYRVRFYDFYHKGTATFMMGQNVPALNIGTIMEGPQCWVEPPFGNPKKEAKHAELRTKRCNSDIMPQIHNLEERFLLALKTSMTTSTSNSDW